jgi:AcrR family transcriptional regulator
MDGEHATIAATDGRVPGRRGRATRQRLLDSTTALIETTPWRSIKVIDIAREAGTSPATFYQYFENVEQAILVLAEELTEGAGALAELVDGDWSEAASWGTARRVVEGFMEYWERNRAVFRVVELATEEGDLRFRGLRVRALNAVTVTLARVVAADSSRPAVAGADAMAAAATVISMLAHVASHRYGFEFWGIRTSSMSDSQARILHWVVTGRAVSGDADAARRLPAPRTGPVVGGGAAQARIDQARPDPSRRPTA